MYSTFTFTPNFGLVYYQSQFDVNRDEYTKKGEREMVNCPVLDIKCFVNPIILTASANAKAWSISHSFP